MEDGTNTNFSEKSYERLRQFSATSKYEFQTFATTITSAAVGRVEEHSKSCHAVVVALQQHCADNRVIYETIEIYENVLQNIVVHVQELEALVVAKDAEIAGTGKKHEEDIADLKSKHEHDMAVMKTATDEKIQTLREWFRAKYSAKIEWINRFTRLFEEVRTTVEKHTETYTVESKQSIEEDWEVEFSKVVETQG